MIEQWRAAALGLAMAGLTAIPATAQTVTLGAAGADEDLIDTLRAASLLLTLEAEESPTAQNYIAAARADYRRLLTALYTEGYYGGRISILVDGREATAIDPLGGPQSVGAVQIAVEPGPQFDFGRTVVSPVPAITAFPDGFRRGEPARSTVIEDAARTGVRAWREAGHARAEVVGEDIVAVHPEERLDVALAIAPGPVLTFGPLVISGNERVRTDRIREIAGLPRGEVFSPEEVDLAVGRLRRTGAFRSVVLREAEEDGPNRTLPILAELQEDLPRRFGFGIEVSSVDGLTVSGYWLHRNLLGGAERLRVDAELSGIEQGTEGADLRLGAEFTRPGTFNPDTDLFVNSELELVQNEFLTFSAIQAELGLNRIVNEEFTTSAALGLRLGEAEVGGETSTYTLVTLPLTATLDRRNDAFDATEGYYIDLEVAPFLGLREAGDGVRVYTDARYYRSFGADDRVTLAARLQFGSVAGAIGEAAPADFLFFSGGGGTVRGQEFESLAVDRDGVPGGGNSFLGAQLEARVGVTRNIEGVAFYDFGLVGTDPLPADDDPSHSGAGLGLRYKTGIGPIRLDLATPVSGDETGQSVQVYIGIGQSF